MTSLLNWVPYQLQQRKNDWRLDWMDMKEHHIQEPFFDETISLCLMKMRERSTYKPLSNMEFLLEAALKVDHIAPTAFIFHVSRCGSTLLSQALSTDSLNMVYAEAPLLDQILRAPFQDKNSRGDIEKWFKAALKIMGQQRKCSYQQLYIKLDSWHVHFYPLLRRWFPRTPFYFLSREPDAVIASHKKRRGLHSIPGIIQEHLLKVQLNTKHYEDFNLFTSEVLTQYYLAMQGIAIRKNPLDYFFDYSWGISDLVAHFFSSIGIISDKENEMMRRFSYHSKYPDQPFTAKQDMGWVNYPKANNAYRKLIASL
ncbi:hypothetical protein [Pedobacter sp. KLB.chiD]|uniref:hypothetical protein n=1 Tax=Pedobacter sp. KLB.chiD TaxID=3387402 RepID=UPI00399B8E81